MSNVTSMTYEGSQISAQALLKQTGSALSEAKRGNLPRPCVGRCKWVEYTYSFALWCGLVRTVKGRGRVRTVELWNVKRDVVLLRATMVIVAVRL